MALQLAEAFISINIPTGSVSTAMSNIKNTINQNVLQIQGGFTQVINNITNVGGASVAAAARMQSLTERAVAVAAGFLSAQAAVQAFIVAIRESLDLQGNLIQSQSILSNVTATQKKEFRDLAVTLSTQTGIGAEKLAKSLFTLGQAGLTASDQLKALPVVARFSIAANEDLIKSTELLTQVQAALGLRVQGMSDETAQAAINLANMQRVSDLMSKASVMAQGSILDFSEALANKGAAAIAKYGVSIEDGVAILASFAEKGIRGQRAGTAMDLVLRTLSQNAIKFSDTFRKLNIDPFDQATGKAKDAGTIFKQLDAALSKLSTRSRVAVLAELFPQRGGGGFIAELAKSSKEIQRYSDNLKNAAGTTDTIFAKAMEDPRRELARLGQQFLSFGRDVGEKFVGTFIVAVKPLASLFSLLDRIDSVMNGFASSLTAVGLGFGFAKAALPSLLGMLGRLLFAKLAADTAEFVDKIGLVGPAVRKVTAAFHHLLENQLVLFGGEFASILLRPFTFAIDAIATAIGAIAGVGIIANIREAFEGVFKALVTPEVIFALKRNAEAFANFARSLAEVFARIGQSVLKLGVQVADFVLRKLGLQGIEALPETMEGIINALGNVAQQASVVLSVLSDNWDMAWGLIVNVLQSAVVEIKDAFHRILAEARLFMAGLVGIVADIPDSLAAFLSLTNPTVIPAVKAARTFRASLIPGGVPAGKTPDQAIAAQQAGIQAVSGLGREMLIKLLGGLVRGGQGDSSIAKIIDNELERRNLSAEREKTVSELGKKFKEALSEELPLEAPPPGSAGSAAKEEGDLNIEVSKRTIPLFSKFEDLGRQIQESLIKDDKLGNIASSLEQANQHHQQVASNTEKTAAAVLAIQSGGGAQSAGPGTQTVIRRSPGISQSAQRVIQRTVPLEAPPPNAGRQRVIRRGE